MGVKRHGQGGHPLPRNGVTLAARHLGAAPLRSYRPCEAKEGSASRRQTRVCPCGRGRQATCPQRLTAESLCRRRVVRTAQKSAKGV
jgi:hypothetical protein